MRELARQDYLGAYPGELVDRVNRDMLLKNVDNVLVVESRTSPKRLLEEESVEKGGPAAAAPVQPK